MPVIMRVAMRVAVLVSHEVEDEQHATGTETSYEALGCLFRMIKVVETETGACCIEVEELR